MNKFFTLFFVALSSFGLTAQDADAKRMGGGRSMGMQRSSPPQAAPQAPTQQAAPAAAPAPPRPRRRRGPAGGSAPWPASHWAQASPRCS